MRKVIELMILLVITGCSYQVFAESSKKYEIDVYNYVDKDLYLYFDAKSVTNGNFEKGAYKQPWGDGSLALDKPYTITFENIETGAIWFVLATQDLVDRYINASPPTALPGDSKEWIGGFFECTALPEQKSYFDLTNIDQTGLLCGFKQGDMKWGYNGTAIEFINGIMSQDYCNITGDNKETAYGAFTVNNVEYQKLLGPPMAKSAYSDSANKYLAALKKNGTTVEFKSDKTIDDPPQHQGTEFSQQFTFTGTFTASTTAPSESGIDPQDIILTLTAKDCPEHGKDTMICYTKKALNGGTIMAGDSDGGVYVRPGFEYVNKGETEIEKTDGWAKDVDLNWSANVDPAVWNTTGFMTMISSVGRDLVTALNLGYIGVTPEKKSFKYDDQSYWATEATQKLYINQWNRYITGHSNAYGMSYSDNAHAKVLYHPIPGTKIECHIFGQNDQKTKYYYSSTTPSDPSEDPNYIR